MKLRHATLFSGIGAAEIAAQRLDWTNVFNCEIDPFCRKVLKYHFPDAIQYSDIHETDFTIWRGRIDVLTGGFPCQPFSLAGKRKGTDDERHLWPEMLRAIREIRPRWIVGENVFGIVNWSDGMVFEQVCSDLEAEGYEVQPYIFPAAGVGAPHKRDRVWFVAHASGYGRPQDSERRRCADCENKEQSECPHNHRLTQDSHQDGRRGEFREEKPEAGRQRDVSSGNNERICSDDGEVRIITDSADTETKDVSGRENGVLSDGTTPDPSRLEDQRRGQVGFQSELARVDDEGVVADTRSQQLQVRSQNDFTTNRKENSARLDYRTERSGDIEIVADPGIERCHDRGDNRQERHIQNDIGASEKGESKRDGWGRRTGEVGENIADSDGLRPQRREKQGGLRACGTKRKQQSLRSFLPNWQEFPAQSPVCGGDDGISDRLAGITFPRWRQESIKALGNAIVPQVIYQIYRAINTYSKNREK